jgi:hypothetical protein
VCFVDTQGVTGSVGGFASQSGGSSTEGWTPLVSCCGGRARGCMPRPGAAEAVLGDEGVGQERAKPCFKYPSFGAIETGAAPSAGKTVVTDQSTEWRQAEDEVRARSYADTRSLDATRQAASRSVGARA